MSCWSAPCCSSPSPPFPFLSSEGCMYFPDKQLLQHPAQHKHSKHDKYDCLDISQQGEFLQDVVGNELRFYKRINDNQESEQRKRYFEYCVKCPFHALFYGIVL